MRSVRFETYVPLSNVEKSTKDQTTSYVVEGIASNNDRDLQGEVIQPEGLNIEYLLNSGYIDYEHDKDSVIGVPINDGTFVDSDGLHLKALIFGDDPRVQKMFKLQKQFDSNKINRSLGFSIEGKVLDRDAIDESIVREVMVTGVALTYRPACDSARVNSWSKVVKSISGYDSLDDVEKSLESTNKTWEAGAGISPGSQHDGAALRSESIEGGITTLAEQIKKLEELGVDAEELEDKLAYILSGKNFDNTTRRIFLQLYSGLSEKDSLSVLNESFNEKAINRAAKGSDGDDSDDDDSDD